MNLDITCSRARLDEVEYKESPHSSNLSGEPKFGVGASSQFTFTRKRLLVLTTKPVPLAFLEIVSSKIRYFDEKERGFLLQNISFFT